MPEYDGLPLDTPTLVFENSEAEVWATRTANGGMVEHRPKPNTPPVIRMSLEGKAVAAIATNNAFLALPSPTQAQTLAHVKTLTRENNALIRILLGRLEADDA